MLTIGSVCVQLEFLPDAEWNADRPRGTLNIKWSGVVRDAQDTECGRPAFGDPVRLDRSSKDSGLQPIARFRFRVDSEWRQGMFVPVLRGGAGRMSAVGWRPERRAAGAAIAGKCSVARGEGAEQGPRCR